jgi:hypothetical protein
MPSGADYAAEMKLNPHAATTITVYVNNAGREAMFLKEPRRFPEGSVIVKKKEGATWRGRTPLLYTIMIKRRTGYNPEVGDWEFAVASADGATIQASGKLENCQKCHVSKPDTGLHIPALSQGGIGRYFPPSTCLFSQLTIVRLRPARH